MSTLQNENTPLKIIEDHRKWGVFDDSTETLPSFTFKDGPFGICISIKSINILLFFILFGWQ